VAKVPGRDQRGPMERLVRIAAVLAANGERGVSGERLAELAGFTGTDHVDQLNRELRHLKKQGWQIDNIAAPGEPSRYRMTTVDNRLRVRLTPAQQQALRRAALLADRSDLAARLGLPETERPAEVDARLETADADPGLATVLRAVRLGAVLRFTYKATPRVVHPESVRTQNGTWYLRGLEDLPDRPAEGPDEGAVKTFVVTRMSDIDADPPGTARRVHAATHTGLHPMSWEVDPPVEVTLRTTPAYLDDVRRWLGEPVSVEDHDESVVVRYQVTNRSALRARLYELGRRVRLLGPEDVRQELLDELAAVAGVEGAQ
jgi:predicted DNA-binding transcriptional regulator YafY